MRERIQKILSARGVASRRKAEEMIVAGRVAVNGAICRLGDLADPETDEILATRIGYNYSTRVVTSDSLVQLSSFRSGLLRMSARELRESVENARGEISDLLTKLKYSEDRKFHQRDKH